MVKIGRNDPCKCGSGKKYKNCCGDQHVNKKLSKSKIHFSPTAKKTTSEQNIIRLWPNGK